MEFVAVKILGPLPRITKKNQCVIMITERYEKLARAIPASITTATQVANNFFESLTIPYGITKHVLTDYGIHFSSKLFAALCTALGAKYLTRTAYRTQTNGQVER